MSQEKPNVLLIMADQHRADCIGSYGNDEIETPNLDSLSEDGIVFDQSFCASPLCTPSRYSMLTGLYPHQHLGWDNGSSIPPDIQTFPKVLQENGYRTRVIGKMHLTPTRMDVGFDEMDLAEQNGVGRYEDDYHHYLMQHGVVDEIDLMDQVDELRQTATTDYWESFGAMESNLPEQLHSTAWIGRRSIEDIREWSGAGNFLMASFIKPHHPFDPPRPWSQKYNPQTLTLLPGWAKSCMDVDLAYHSGFFPHGGLNESALRKVMAYYYANISHMDFYIGQMIEALKEKGLYDNTFIIYVSDHGEYLGFHHLLLKQNHMYDPLMRVPMIMKPPHPIRKGVRNGKLISNIDLPATILGELQFTPIQGSPGINVLDPRSNRRFVFSEELYGKQYMIRSERRKLIITRDGPSPLLFDLDADPMEFHNVYGQASYEADVNELTNCLHQLLLFDHPSMPYYPKESHRARDHAEIQESVRWIQGKFRERSSK